METATLVRERFAAAGQAHVFAFWDRLTPPQQESLLSQAREIDLAEVRRLYQTLVQGGGETKLDFAGLQPAPYVPHPDHGGEAALWASARAEGEKALRAGRVACFTVAGGQGTRLGYDGPKGTFPVTPVKHKTLFQVFAEKILAARRRYRAAIPWFIMTSHANHAATEAAFQEADYFGLPAEDVFFFVQGRMPAVDPQGRILLEAPDTIAMSPDGHGGSLRALVRSGATAKMKERGIDTLSYFQVDNPLVQVIDPAFIGFHLRHQAEMSSKMIPKAYPEEKIGMFCTQKGRMLVIEYSDMPLEMQRERDAQGKLRFLAGSIAIHILAVPFVDRMGGTSEGALPFHRAHKKIPTIDAEGQPVSPEKPNGYKFEMFVFDAVPHAANTVVIETKREDDFSPVKNKEGLDSPQSCRDDQVRQWTRWLAAAGTSLPIDSTGLPPFAFEVSPLFADTQAAFVEKWSSLAAPAPIKQGSYLG